MKAYLVDCGSEEGARLHFAEKASKAKYLAANEEGIDYIEVGSCIRKPEFDQYAPGPVPPMVLLEDGWWFECNGCNRRVEEDMEEGWDDDEPVELDGPIVRGNRVWCSTKCQSKDDARTAARKELELSTIAAAVAKWPNAEHVKAYVRGDGKWCADFDFGGKQSAIWPIGDDSAYVANQDIEAWEIFRARKN